VFSQEEHTQYVFSQEEHTQYVFYSGRTYPVFYSGRTYPVCVLLRKNLKRVYLIQIMKSCRAG
jgi:hypothetical protein